MSSTADGHRFVSAASVIALALSAIAAVAVAAPQTASATTVERSGIVIKLPSHGTVYNGKRLAVRPAVKVRYPVRKKIASVTALAFSGGRQVEAGRTVRLAPGSYRVKTKVAFQRWTMRTRYKTVTVHHHGDYVDLAQCTVTAVWGDDGTGAGNDIKRGECTNHRFPGETMTDRDPFPTRERSRWSVGDRYIGQDVWFKGYDSREKKSYRVKAFQHVESFTTSGKSVVVHDGGHLKHWSGDDTYTTGYTRVPSGAEIDFSYATEDPGYTCYAGLDAETAAGGFKSLLDVYRYHGYRSWETTASMRIRFDVFSSCDWDLYLSWK